jgi:hypothetical protein
MISIASRLHKAYTEPIVHQSRGKSGFYPSQTSIKLDDGTVLGGCHRQIYYDWNNYEREGEANADWTLAAIMGEWYHTGITEELRAHPIETGITVLAEELPFFDKELFVSGRVDMLLLDNETNTIFGEDTKSVGEWVCKKTVHAPKWEHVLQCALYLWVFQNKTNPGDIPISHWSILYISRDENWDLKAYKHGSKLKQIWQFDLTFSDDKDPYVIIENERGEKTHHMNIRMSGIIKRFKTLKEKMSKDELPDRDYEAQYDDAKMVAMHKAGQLEFKKDQAVVDKWLKKGATGPLGLIMGDSACRFCPYTTQCYSKNPETPTTKQNSPPHSIKDTRAPAEKPPTMF